VRVGGNLKAPRKIKDVKPEYPQEAKDNGLQGVVILEGVIGADGRVREARILRSVRGLDEAAMTAMLQWEFTQTLLNGAPIPVVMTVTVNFTLNEKKAVSPDDQAAAGAQEGVLIGGNIAAPQKLVDVQPVYPPEAREAGVQGVVIAVVTIDEGGNVIDARIVRGIPQLDQAALDAVRQWKYEASSYPRRIMTVTVRFTLQ
jgi:TonB family protein